MMDLSEFIKSLPEHQASLTIEHNEHKTCYQTVAELIANNYGMDYCDLQDWVSSEEMAKSIETNELWTIQWYPNTPVGFHIKHASTLEALIEYFQNHEN